MTKSPEHHEHSDHSHDHSHAGHSHDHGHTHAPPNFNRAFVIGVSLNTAFVLAEVIYGLKAGSLALISDAGHNLSDVLGLLLAWGAMRLSQSRPSARRTYGVRRSSILAALGNAAALLFVTGAVSWEALLRLRHPEPVAAGIVMWVAALGIVINSASALLFFSGRQHDVNVRGAFMHLAADALVSVGVVIAGFLISRTGWLWLDPVVSIGIGVVILLGTWGLLMESLNLAMDAVPAHIDPGEVERYLASLPGVTAVHDLHIWAMSTTETALTAHLVAPGAGLDDQRLLETCEMLRTRFRIGHCTIQLEHGAAAHPHGYDPASAV